MSEKIKVLSVFGTRPEAIKLAPVIHAFNNDARFESIVCVTGQHREMLDQVLNLFSIKPHYDLDLMRSNQSLSDITAAVLTQLPAVLEAATPDWVIVQGDTTTVMSACLAAFYAHIKIAHVEAGLRTSDKQQPFPEELNRRIASVVADLHFAPTSHARDNLLREGISPESIVVTGNTVIDALRKISVLPMDKAAQTILTNIGVLENSKKLILVTAHRRENFGEPLNNICAALKSIAAQYGNQVEILYPVHLNPNVWEPVHQILGTVDHITLVKPQEYLTMIHLLKHASFVLTDSGGIQEEATGLGLPCLVLREKTERPEGVEAGILKLVGTKTQDIFTAASILLSSENSYLRMSKAENPFGDGHAAEKILQSLVEKTA